MAAMRGLPRVACGAATTAGRRPAIWATAFQGVGDTVFGLDVALLGCGLFALLGLLAVVALRSALALEGLINASMLAASAVGVAVNLVPTITMYRSHLAPGVSRVVATGAAILCLLLAAAGRLPHLKELPGAVRLSLQSIAGACRRWVILGSVAILGTLWLAALLSGGGTTAPDSLDVKRILQQSPRQELLRPEGPASVSVVVFADFQCPGCSWAHEEVNQVKKSFAARFPDTVTFGHRDYPLDPACNRFIREPLHPAACAAAVAARLAAANGRLDEFEDWLYSHQNGLTADLVWHELGQSMLAGDMHDARHRARLAVEADIELAHQVGVSGTPSIFVNGVNLGAVNAVALEEAILLELAK